MCDVLEGRGIEPCTCLRLSRFEKLEETASAIVSCVVHEPLQEAEDEEEPVTQKQTEHILAENDEYFFCAELCKTLTAIRKESARATMPICTQDVSGTPTYF